jgi:hypothetical protein
MSTIMMSPSFSSRLMDSFSDDLWEVVQDIAREPSLVAVCQRTYRLLRGRHVICHPATVGIANLVSTGCLRSFDFRCPHNCRDRRAEIRAMVTQLAAPPHRCAELRDLRLDLWCSGVGSDGMRPLGALIRDRMPVLESLTLILWQNRIRGNVDALVPFGRRLRHLRLDLSGNQVGEHALHALLRGLSGARTLERVTARPDLTPPDRPTDRGRNGGGGGKGKKNNNRAVGSGLPPLNLKECNIRDAGAAALADGLRDLPRLQFADLNVALNGLGRSGAESLSELVACPALAELRLDVNRNKIGDGGALRLRRLAGAPCLTRLRLLVHGCDLSDACVRSGPVGQSVGRA